MPYRARKARVKRAALRKIADELGARRRGLAGRQLGLTPR
jgi:hypothetical protein